VLWPDDSHTENARNGKLIQKKYAVYYGHPVSMDGILFTDQVAPSEAEQALSARIDESSQ
jgi:hypothetical protein